MTSKLEKEILQHKKLGETPWPKGISENGLKGKLKKEVAKLKLPKSTQKTVAPIAVKKTFKSVCTAFEKAGWEAKPSLKRKRQLHLSQGIARIKPDEREDAEFFIKEGLVALVQKNYYKASITEIDIEFEETLKALAKLS